MASVLTEIITLLTGGISAIASGIGQGVSTLVQAIFLSGAGTTENPYTLSVFGGVVILFAAIALAVGLCRWVMNFVTSLGAQH